VQHPLSINPPSEENNAREYKLYFWIHCLFYVLKLVLGKNKVVPPKQRRCFLAQIGHYFGSQFEFSPLPDTSVQETTLLIIPPQNCVFSPRPEGEGLGVRVENSVRLHAQSAKVSSCKHEMERGKGVRIFAQFDPPPLNAV
jgi:hypothetical protein